MDDLLELTGRAEASHFWFHGFRAFIRPVLSELAGTRRDLRMLDCGCGTGHNLALLRGSGQAVGFDITHGMLVRARQGGAHVVRADITRIPFSSESFDIVTSFDVLQCVDADRASLREMGRVVRPGGRILLTIAALDLLRGDHAEVWREVRRYTPDDARRLVEAAGLRVERISFLFASLFPLMLAARTVQRLTRPFRAVRADVDISVPPAPVNAMLTALVRAEAALSRRLPMPVGSSLLVVAARP